MQDRNNGQLPFGNDFQKPILNNLQYRYAQDEFIVQAK